METKTEDLTKLEDWELQERINVSQEKLRGTPNDEDLISEAWRLYDEFKRRFPTVSIPRPIKPRPVAPCA